MSALQSAVVIGGVLTLVLAGVRLRIDKRLEEFFIEVDPSGFDREAASLLTTIADGLGYEVMPEWECPPQVMSNGAIRHWMAEKEVVHERVVQTI
jgi:hypothetical protein